MAGGEWSGAIWNGAEGRVLVWQEWIGTVRSGKVL